MKLSSRAVSHFGRANVEGHGKVDDLLVASSQGILQEGLLVHTARLVFRLLAEKTLYIYINHTAITTYSSNDFISKTLGDYPLTLFSLDLFTYILSDFVGEVVGLQYKLRRHFSIV